jgi:putative acetyltransferase
MVQIGTFQRTIIDHTALVAMVRQIQLEEFGLDQPLEAQPDLMDIDTYYLERGGGFWVATLDDQIVGCVGLLRLADGIGEIKKMYVTPPYRGAQWGVGQLMMDTLRAWALTHGFRRIYLDTLATMHAAIRFYERNGFVEADPRTMPGVYYHPIAVDTSVLKYFELGLD